MLNPLANPLHASTDLAKVGDFVIDVPRREVSCALREEPFRLTVKALHVFLALANQPGKVVSREALMEWVWPDTLPTDDVLTQAVGQLRKAFCDDRDSPRYLETIAKGGYRLLPVVEWIEPVASPHAVHNTSAQSPVAVDGIAGKRWPGWLPMVAGFALLALALALGWRYWRDGKAIDGGPAAPAANASLPLEFRTITSRPGRETSPNLSPDGSMVAYEQYGADGNSAIMLQTTAHVPARQLTFPPAGHGDVLPVWSRDGRRLAFVRYDTDSRCKLMLVAPSGGEAQTIADCFAGSASNYDWTPDGSGLLMGPGVKTAQETSSPLRLLDIASGQWRKLDYTIADGDIDIDPHYSPDGRWIVFRRNISLSDLWRMPASGGSPQRLTQLKGDIRGWDWVPDGSALIYSFVGNVPGMYRYEFADGSIARLEIERFASSPDIALRAPSMVFALDQEMSGIFRYSLPGAAGGAVARTRVFASSASELLPAVSPDGRRLAFISDRSARMELWLGEFDKPDAAHPVESFMPMPRHSPVWSADGTRLLVIGMQDDQQALFEVAAESGRTQVLPVPASSPIYAAYNDKPQQLLVGSDGGEGRLRVVLYDRAQQPWRELASLADVALLRFDPVRNEVYFTRVTKPGIWRADPQLGQVRLLDAARPRMPREYRRWDIGANGPYFLQWSEACASAWIRMGTPAAEQGLCLDREAEAWAISPSADRAGEAIYLTMTTSSNADIGWAELSSLVAGTPQGVPTQQ